MSLRTLAHAPAYYCLLLLFALGGLELSLLGLLLGWLPGSPAVERWFQRVIHLHLRIFHEACALFDIVQVRLEGFDQLAAGGVVLVANHRSLVDITCLLGQLPEALCIFKPAIRRNPVLGAAARRAGYLGSDGGHDLVRAAAAKVAGGNKLVIFPEGTRNAGGELLPFKPGFAVIARRAGVPIQPVRIVTDSDLLVKGVPIWRLPRVPARFRLTLGPVMASDGDPAATCARVEAWFGAGATAAPACPASVARLAEDSR